MIGIGFTGRPGTGSSSGPVQKSTANDGAGTHTTSGTPSTSTQIVPARSRTKLRITNDHATAKVYLGWGTAAVVGRGDPLLPGQTIIEDTWTGDVRSISTTASVPIAFIDT